MRVRTLAKLHYLYTCATDFCSKGCRVIDHFHTPLQLPRLRTMVLLVQGTASSMNTAAIKHGKEVFATSTSRGKSLLSELLESW